jgi:hypothetical protein
VLKNISTRLEVGVDGRLARRPETDQQIGDQPHRFPAEEQLHEVVGHHQHQHREGEQRDVAEEALIAVGTGTAVIRPVVFVIGHITDGVDMDHQ